MARPRGDGFKIVKRQLADGTIAEYRYARGRLDAASPEKGTMASLIREYEQTPDYDNLKPRTRELYASYLAQIEDRLGGMAIKSFRPSHIEMIRDSLKHQRSRANMWLALLSILFGLARRREYIPTNPASSAGRLPPAKRIQIWEKADEERALAAFRPSLRLAFMLLLYTVQRPSDVLAMTKGQVTERHGRLYIQLRQQKTDTLIAVPVHGRLEPMLRARIETTDSLLLIPSPRGLRWQRRNFSRAWDHDLGWANWRLAKSLFWEGKAKAEVRAELDSRHRQRRDLRRTGIVRLAEAGATTPQIAAISGHSIDFCQKIIDTYLPRRTEVALGGIEAWEKADSVVVSLMTHRQSEIVLETGKGPGKETVRKPAKQG